MDTTLLPAAIRGDKTSLSATARSEILALNGACSNAFTGQLISAWLVIVAAIAFALYIDTIFANVVAICIIATRQNILGLLVHEQTHLLGYRHRYGDVLVNLFAAYPLILLTVEDYAQVHLAHHRHYFTAADPDFNRKHGESWSTPMGKLALARLLLIDLFGLNTIRAFRGKKVKAKNISFVRRNPTSKALRPIFFISWAAIFSVTGTWSIFLLFWLLPILTVTQVLVRWGALCEHKYNLENASVADSTPLIILRWWERLLLPNLNFSMHAYHHYFPGISFSRLPAVHRIFLREGLIESKNLFTGYFSFLLFITRKASRESNPTRSPITPPAI